jgi:hypothetical protein
MAGLTHHRPRPVMFDRLVLAALLTGVVLVVLTVIHPAAWWTLLFWVHHRLHRSW